MSAFDDRWIPPEAEAWPPMSQVERRRLVQVFGWLDQRAGAPPGNDEGPVPVKEPDPVKTSANWSKATCSRRCQGHTTDSGSVEATTQRSVGAVDVGEAR